VNSSEAKQVLLLYRPGTEEAADPEMAEALALAARDPELGQWFEQHRAFQKAMRAKLRQIAVPTHLRTSILARGQGQPSILMPPQPRWRTPVWLGTAAAAALVVLVVLAASWLRPATTDHFANYRTRMVGQVLREYQANMSIITNDMREVRQHLAAHGAPADYVVPRGLEHLQLTGAGRLTWRNNPVAMVCFDRGNKQMLFLFVMKRSGVKDPPTGTPQLTPVNELTAASWTEGDKTYVLAGHEEADALRKYL
jgi:hypothetical protein